MSDTEARDMLAQIINEPVDADYAMADAIIAAGWRPPARTVTTAEELDALPVGSIVRDVERAALDEKWGNDTWAELAYEHTFFHPPATVVYEPEEDE